jgi:hypothetical protein
VFYGYTDTENKPTQAAEEVRPTLALTVSRSFKCFSYEH